VRTLSLRWRLVLTVSVVIALVLSLESILEIRLFQKSAERDLRETGLVTAEAVVDDLELRRGPWVPAEIEDGLREFARGVPSIRAISLVQLSDGVPTVVASTASSESDRALALAKETIIAGDDRFPGQRDGLIGIRGCSAGNNGGHAGLQPHERDGANRRHPVRELAQAVLDFRGDPGPSPQLQVVDDGFGGDKTCLAKVALGGFLEQADLEHRLDAQDEGDDHRDGQDEAPAERQCAHPVRPVG